MTLLYEVGNRCVRIGNDVQRCLDDILETAITLTGADKGNLQLLDQKNGTLTIAAHRGFSKPFLSFFNAVRTEVAAACAEAMRSGERVIIEDVTKSPIFAGQPSLDVLLDAGVRAVQSTPLVSADGMVFGMISTHFDEPHRPGERELRLMDLLARQAADYLERRHAEEALRAKEAELQLDIAERKRAEEALRLKDTELEVILNQTPFMLTRCTRDLHYRFVSRAYAHMLGHEPQDIAGKPIVEFMGHEGLKTVMPYIERVLGGEQVEYEAEVPFENVGTRSLGVVYTPDRDERGEVIGWIASIADISDRKRAETQRERLLQAEHELRHIAEEANRLKDEFLATMSHELRNPLNVILGYSELLVRSQEITDAEPVRRMAEAIRRNAIAQAKLICDLLDLSRLRSGKLEINRETVSLMTSVSNAIDTVRSDAEDKQIAIEVVGPDMPLFVKGDPVRLEQIIWNLLNNSVKFTPAGGKIVVRADADGDRVSLSVEDNGQGIDSSFLPHVFEMFRQANTAASRVQAGMGIGLAVVQQLITLHQGSITVTSDGPGKGAKFTIELPSSMEEQTRHTPVVARMTPLDQLAVLLVDDSEDTTEMLSELLRMNGATVISATSGHEGLSILSDKHFDVVLSDISMPGMDGFEFLRRLRQLPGRGELPALALTGFGRPEDIERAHAEGFNSHITKPIELDRLISVLQTIPKTKP